MCRLERAHRICSSSVCDSWIASYSICAEGGLYQCYASDTHVQWTSHTVLLVATKLRTEHVSSQRPILFSCPFKHMHWIDRLVLVEPTMILCMHAGWDVTYAHASKSQLLSICHT